MTQEEKRLLLQDLAARLPYGVIVRLDYRDGTIVTREMGIGSFHDMLFGNTKGKPYLRPLTSMTEEEKKIIADKCGFSFKGPVGGKIDLVMSILAVDWLIDFYNKNYFGYRGLIEKGLAIAVTEENNPYKAQKGE